MKDSLFVSSVQQSVDIKADEDYTKVKLQLLYSS